MASSRTVIVTGATGLLGRQVAREFGLRGWTVKGTGLSRADGQDILKVDLSKGDDVEKMLDEVKPQVVVHCAANRYPDLVEKDPEGARALNVEASRVLARLCARRSVLLLYLSTDYVFSGRKGEAPYATTDAASPTTQYGALKYDGEVAVLGEFERAPGREGLAAVLRVPVLYGHAEVPAESAVNVLMDVVWKAQRQQAGEDQGGHAGPDATAARTDKIKVDHWAVRHPTNTEDVARVLHDVAVKYLAAGPANALPRTLQFSSGDSMTKYDICEAYAEIMGLSMDGIEADTAGNKPGTVQKPYDCRLSTEALRDLGISTATCDFKAWWRREVHAFRR